jgi:transcriptional regulator with XRE-family HTH domain
MVIGYVLRKWRESERLTIREAAPIVGLTAPTLNRVERGEAMNGATLAQLFIWLTSKADHKKRQRALARLNHVEARRKR